MYQFFIGKEICNSWCTCSTIAIFICFLALTTSLNLNFTITTLYNFGWQLTLDNIIFIYLFFKSMVHVLTTSVLSIKIVNNNCTNMLIFNFIPLSQIQVLLYLEIDTHVYSPLTIEESNDFFIAHGPLLWKGCT